MSRRAAAAGITPAITAGPCPLCGIPADAKVFDESGVVDLDLRVGETLSLARFELPPQYCGLLQYIAQYTDEQAEHPRMIRTRGLEWFVLVNGHPLYPYIALDRILNPWGIGGFEIAIRLDEAAVLEMVVRRTTTAALSIAAVGGRLVGRYWYNPAYGDVAGSRS